MLPLFRVGPWQASTYQLLQVLAATIAGTWAFDRLLRLGLPPQRTARWLLLTLVVVYVAAHLGARLLPRWSADPPTPIPETDGLGSFWALLGGLGVTVLCCRSRAIPLGRALDLGVLPLPLGLAIARLGCVAAGCCYGKPTNLPLGLYLPDAYGAWAVRFPTQWLSTGANLLILSVLLYVDHHTPRERETSHMATFRQRRPMDGNIAALFVALYSLQRFALAFLRADAVPVLGPLSWMHLTSLAGLLAAAMWIGRRLYPHSVARPRRNLFDSLSELSATSRRQPYDPERRRR